MDPMYLISIIFVLILLYVVVTYNSLINGRLKVQEGWADVDTQLRRRYNLIPNIIETVKGFKTHEGGVLKEVTELRVKALHAKSPQKKAGLEDMLTGSLKKLFAVAEAYPDLKSNQNFLDLQVTLREVEENIQLARRYYNGTVKDYNYSTQSFPNNLIAGMFGFHAEKFFEIIDLSQRKNVKVSF